MTKEQNVLNKQKRERMFKEFDDFCLTDDARTYAMQDKPLGFFRAGYEAADALTNPLEEANRQLRTIIDEENKDHIEQQEKLEERIAELERVYAYECEIRNRRGEMLLEANATIAEQHKELDIAKQHAIDANNSVASLLEQVSDQQKEKGDQLKPDMAYMRNLEERCDSLQKELADCKDAVVILRSAMKKILDEPNETFSDGKVVREVMRLATKALSATSKLVEGYKK